MSKLGVEELKPKHFLCPHITKDYEKLFVVENDFTNTKLRKSFSIDIFKCEEYDHFPNRKCQNDDSIKYALKNFYFT